MLQSDGEMEGNVDNPPSMSCEERSDVLLLRKHPCQHVSNVDALHCRGIDARL
jgi:hypothetical protein